MIVLHPFHQLTFQLPKKKLERGLCFHILLLEVSCVCYYHHFPCQSATYLGIWKCGSRAVLARCRSFIHLFRHLLLSVGWHQCASVSQGNPDESGNFSLQRVYNLVKKLRHVVKTVNNKEHFECCNVSRGQALCECARRKNLALDGKGRGLKK